MQFPKILVTGATGRIGQMLRRCWAGQGGEILWQGRNRPAGAAGDWAVFDPLCDMTAGARAARGCAVILCLAGVTNARAGRGADMDDNARLAEAAIRAGATVGARVLLTSSAAVYGNQPGCLDEVTWPAPQSPYGAAKVAMETRGAELAAELDVAVTSLRIGNISGLDAVLGGWHPGFELDRFADGTTPRRSYIGPATLARVLLDLVQAPSLPPVLNVAAPGVVEMGTLLDAAGLAWTPRSAQEGAIPEVHLSTARLAAFTSFSAADSLPQTLVRQWREVFV